MKKTRNIVCLILAAMLLAVAIPVAALALNEDSAAGVSAYWNIVGNRSSTDPLTRVMNGEDVPLSELTQINADELMAFTAANDLPLEMAQFAWYNAMAEALRVENPATGATAETLALFLSMPETWRDSSLNTERRSIRRSLTEAEVHAMSDETGLPGGFLAWLLLDDEWHEGEWDDMDDWREGRSSWDFADWVSLSEFRAAYGASAVVDDDDVERVLRKNGIYVDD